MWKVGNSWGVLDPIFYILYSIFYDYLSPVSLRRRLASMQAEQARFVEQLMAAWNSHDAERAAVWYAPNFVGVDIAQVAPLHGRKEMEEYFARFFAAFPDVQLQVESVVAVEDHYAIAWTAQGTHLGKLMNIPPSGKHVSVRGITMLRTETGQVVHAQTVWDMAGLLRAIGLLPRLSR
jgi:steroid delta-isomerase-like uncharacterized protein